jgi:short-subunit dehydrogenase
VSRLAGKHIVVTGASSGIGAALALQLGGEGSKVVVAARRLKPLNEVASHVRTAGGEAAAIPCDVTSRDAIFALAAEARERFGEIDAWVSNAGGGILHSALDATEDDMLWQFRLNCLSSLWAYQALLPDWLARGSGHIVDVNTLGGKSGFAYGGGYAAAKGAMSCLGDSVRQEIAGTGVHVTTVYPGITATDFSRVRPDRTGGRLESVGRRLRERRGFIARTILAPQSPEYVARCIVRVLKRPRPVVYPHRWGALATLINNFWPGIALGVVARTHTLGGHQEKDD